VQRPRRSGSLDDLERVYGCLLPDEVRLLDKARPRLLGRRPDTRGRRGVNTYHILGRLAGLRRLACAPWPAPLACAPGLRPWPAPLACCAPTKKHAGKLLCRFDRLSESLTWDGPRHGACFR
jgi:hypothetical protein